MQLSYAGILVGLGIAVIAGMSPALASAPAVITGLYDNTDRTLELDATTGDCQLRAGGTLRGGTLTTRDGAALVITDGNYNTVYSTLDKVTLSPGSDIRLVGRSCVFLRDRLTLNGTMTLDSAGGYPVAAPTYLTPLTIGGTGTLRFVGSNVIGTGVPAAGFQADSLTTLERGLKIEMTGRSYMYGNYISYADVTITSPGQYIGLGGGSAGATFVNHGRVTLNDGILSFAGLADDGVLDLRGGRASVSFATTATPPPTLRERLKAAAATNFSTGPLQSSVAVPGRIGLGYVGDGELAYGAVAPAYFGDSDLDGGVSIQDFNRFAFGFQNKQKGWYSGDYDYDGVVSIQDFNLLAANFGKSLTGGFVDIGYDKLLAFAAANDDLPAFEAATGVPEPAGLAILAGGAALALRRRR